MLQQISRLAFSIYEIESSFIFLDSDLAVASAPA